MGLRFIVLGICSQEGLGESRIEQRDILFIGSEEVAGHVNAEDRLWGKRLLFHMSNVEEMQAKDSCTSPTGSFLGDLGPRDFPKVNVVHARMPRTWSMDPAPS